MTHRIHRPLSSHALAACSLAACALSCTPLPPAQDARGLYSDLLKTVDFQENSTWVVDRLAVEGLQDDVMASVCQSSPEAQEDLRSWIDARFDEELGEGASGHDHPSELAYREEGSMTRRVKRLRQLERVRLLLDAGRGTFAECPYWAEVDHDFAGIEPDEGRFVLLAESIGGGGVRFSGGSTGFGGGGGGRLIGAFGVGRFTLGIGAEVGADGALPESEDGGRSFVGLLSTSVPVLIRYTNVSRILDIEITYRTLWTDERRHGMRVDIGYGLTTPRVAGLMPYALLWVGYEMFPAAHGNPIEHAILGGTRVGFDWDP